MIGNYKDLCIFNFGKRSYILTKNSIKIMYFENNNGKYEMPIVSFNLYDNMGKSLTVVNQNFFMSQLVNRLNVAYKKGIFSDDELVSFLENLKSNIENDAYLRKLFKGSFMNEIDEANFEKNKKEILKYLDSFKFDTFVNYNNVSIFTGSLEKEPVDSSEVVPEESTDEVSEESNEEVTEESTEESVSEESPNEDVSEEPVTQEVNEKPILEENTDVSESEPLSNNEISEDFSVDNLASAESDAVSSSDYFGSSVETSDVSTNSEVLNNTSDVSPDLDISNLYNASLTNDLDVSNSLPDTVQDNSQVDNFDMLDSVPSSVSSTDESSSLENYMWSNATESFDSSALDDNMSYVNDVKERIQNSEPEVKNENPVLESKQEMIQAVPELDDLKKDELPVEDDSELEESGSKKGRIFFIIFLIIFIIFLIGLSYYLYNNVF